ncbi:MAG: hypothetical protein K5840_08445 [Eubacterium sp.]|nr:hypothetical protein [Eubacterium sp.]
MGDIRDYQKLLRRNRLKQCPDCQVDLIVGREGEYSCPRCQKIYYDDFGKIRNFIEKYPDSSIREIMENTKVPRRTIQAYIDYCHLEYSGSSSGYEKCTQCGAPIRCGRICPQCAAKMSEGSYNPYTVGDYKFGYEKAESQRETPKISGYGGRSGGAANDSNGMYFVRKKK